MFYPMPEDDFDEDILEEFVDQVLAGKAKPYIKSAKPPKEQKGDVVTVVGTTFKKIVEDDSKVRVKIQCSKIYYFFSRTYSLSSMHHGVDIVKVWRQFTKNLPHRTRMMIRLLLQNWMQQQTIFQVRILR